MHPWGSSCGPRATCAPLPQPYSRVQQGPCDPPGGHSPATVGAGWGNPPWPRHLAQSLISNPRVWGHPAALQGAPHIPTAHVRPEGTQTPRAVPPAPTPGNAVSILRGKQPFSVTQRIAHSFPSPRYQAMKVLCTNQADKSNRLLLPLPTSLSLPASKVPGTRPAQCC